MIEKRNLHIKYTPVDEAREILMSAVKKIMKPENEMISVYDSLGRVTARDIYAELSSPAYNASAMDGIAVRAADTAGASKESPLELTPDMFSQVNTGNEIIEPFDAVIMAEDIKELENGSVEITSPVAASKNVRAVGEDIEKGQLVLPAGHVIRAIDIGVIIETGHLEIEAVKRPEVAIFPTGSEIVEPETVIGEGLSLKPGQIMETNSRMFENLVIENGGRPHRFDILPDDFDTIKNAVLQASREYDIIITNAGTSAGLKDFTVHVLKDIGQVLLHGVAVKPGKPCILAIVNDRPVIGLPGYPISANVGFENFVCPLLDYLSGRPPERKKTVDAVVTKRIKSKTDLMEYIRVRLCREDGRLVAVPLAKGASVSMSLVRADGILIIPRGQDGLEAGASARVILCRDIDDIE